MAELARTEIPLSKTKMLLSLVFGISFVALGLWFMLDTDRFGGGVSVYSVVGTISVVFFGAVVLFNLFKLPDQKPGLIIDDTGLYDNSSAVAAGFIPWEDIEGFSQFQVKSTRFIVVHVKNPEDYIKKQTSAIKRKLMKLNHANYQSPISISSSALKIKYVELLTKINDAFTHHRHQAANK